MMLRVLVYSEGQHWIAQCLEHDVAAQAARLNDLPTEFEAAFFADYIWQKENGRDITQDPIPAPPVFHKCWDKHSAEPSLFTPKTISLEKIPQTRVQLCMVG